MRLIDADRLSDNIYGNVPAPYEDSREAKEECLRAIEEALTIDAVPVVRCKGCEHAERYERVDGTAGYYCGHPQNTFTYGERWDRVFKPAKEADDFCSYGERKDGADHMEGYND